MDTTTADPTLDLLLDALRAVKEAIDEGLDKVRRRRDEADKENDA